MALLETVKKRISADSALESELWAGWNRICDKIHAYASNHRPKLKSFEVHHVSETCRKAYLEAFADGETVAESEYIVARKFPFLEGR